MNIHTFLFTLLICWCAGEKPEKCPIFQTTDPKTPCYLLVHATEDSRPVPPFVYAFSLPHPSTTEPCPIRQSFDPAQECYTDAKSNEAPVFQLVVPLPKDADRLDDSLYVTKSPSQLSFPNPWIRVQ